MAHQKKKKTRHSNSDKTYHAPDALSRSAFKLIDQAAGLLKEGIVTGARRSAKGRQALKKKALSLVTSATHKLNDALREGSAAVRKGLNKI